MLRPDTAASASDDKSVEGTLPVHERLNGAGNVTDEKTVDDVQEKDASHRAFFPWSRNSSRPGTATSRDKAGKHASRRSSDDASSATEKDPDTGAGTIAVGKDTTLPPVGFTEMFR